MEAWDCSQEVKGPKAKSIIEEAAKGTYFTARLFGFWPYETENGCIMFNWRSRGSYLSLLNITVLSAVVLIVSMNRNGIFSPLVKETKTSSTEATGQALLIFVKTATAFSLYVVAVTDRNRLISLWNNINRTTTLISYSSSIQASKCFKLRLYTIQNRGKLFMSFYFLLSLLQSLSDVWPLVPHMFNIMKLWRACLCSASLLWWNLVGNMYVAFAFMFVTFTKVLSSGFVTLTHQLKEMQLEQQLASMVSTKKEISTRIAKKSILRVIKLGKQLEALSEELNGKMKIPFVIILVSTVINSTIAIFFTALTIERSQFTVNGLSLVLSCLLCMLPLKVLCSTGSELTSMVSFLRLVYL